ncbi:type II toxin-antitoxin system VapC family toxin [Roseofilum reptotaenium CS-1145]|uniref:PIN domain-containing protein n=1 Tax=Roseofilum reptotaenium AO1-A TaxID=1925591 RepID=A0A1L9QS96_9CYAN|nr:type II toxin-antitoxin system VapC family toxin [Roseofilum reptotaenium CS-1145]OJJ25543.1 hypothetical protein BI308_11315 [Roseofilum reptotaenium AO1-A]
MKILLDTHIFLWLITNNRQLDDRCRNAISNQDNDVYLSVVSVWEAMIKYQLGKLSLPASPEIYLPEQRERHEIRSLSIRHLLKPLKPLSIRFLPHHQLGSSQCNFNEFIGL